MYMRNSKMNLHNLYGGKKIYVILQLYKNNEYEHTRFIKSDCFYKRNR